MRRAAVLALLASFLLTAPADAGSPATGRLLVSLERPGDRAQAAAPAPDRRDGDDVPGSEDR